MSALLRAVLAGDEWAADRLDEMPADELETFFRALLAKLGGPDHVQTHAPTLRRSLGPWFGALFLTQLSCERPGDVHAVALHVERRLQATARELVLWDPAAFLANVVLASRNQNTVDVTFCTALRLNNGFGAKHLEQFNRALDLYVRRYGTTARRPQNLLRPRSMYHGAVQHALLRPLEAEVLVSECTTSTAVSRLGSDDVFTTCVLTPAGMGSAEQTQLSAGADTFFQESTHNMGAVATAYILHTKPLQPTFVQLAESLLMQIATIGALAEAHRRGREIESAAAGAREKATHDLAGWLSHEGVHYATWLRSLANTAASERTLPDIGRVALSRRLSSIADMIGFTTRLTEFTIEKNDTQGLAAAEFAERLEGAWELIRDDDRGDLTLEITERARQRAIPNFLLAFSIELVRNAWRHRTVAGEFAASVGLSASGGGFVMTVESGPHEQEDIRHVMALASEREEARGRSRGWILLRRWSSEFHASIAAESPADGRLRIVCETLTS